MADKLFSERMGFTPARKVLQVDGMDAWLCKDVWDFLCEFVIVRDLHEFYAKHANKTEDSSVNYPKIHKMISNIVVRMFDVYIEDTHEWSSWEIYEHLQYKARDMLREKSYGPEGHWYKIFDFIELFYLEASSCGGVRITINNKNSIAAAMDSNISKILYRNGSGYRFFNGKFIRITDDIELDAIDETQAGADQFSGAAKHIETALHHLSNRQKPDYRNSIKEAISAVESVCCIISNSKKASLGDALKSLSKNGIVLNPRLNEALEKIYAYTNSEKGVRHSLFEDKETVSFDDAKFMLVSCAAFVNYLKALHLQESGTTPAAVVDGPEKV